MTTNIAAGQQPVSKRRQRALERRELVVHGDPDRLKEPSEIRRAASGTEHRTDRADEVVARRHRARLSAANHFARQPPRVSLVAIRSKRIGQRFAVGRVEEIGGGHGLRPVVSGAHAHVERSAGAKAEPSTLVVDLVRRDAQVEEHAVDRDAVERVDPRRVDEVRPVGGESPGRGEARSGARRPRRSRPDHDRGR